MIDWRGSYGRLRDREGKKRKCDGRVGEARCKGRRRLSSSLLRRGSDAVAPPTVESERKNERQHPGSDWRYPPTSSSSLSLLASLSLPSPPILPPLKHTLGAVPLSIRASSPLARLAEDWGTPAFDDRVKSAPRSRWSVVSPGGQCRRAADRLVLRARVCAGPAKLVTVAPPLGSLQRGSGAGSVVVLWCW